MALDWRQTQGIVEAPQRYTEQNQILGSHPSMLKLNVLYVLWVPVHAGISCILPQPYRSAWQIGTIGVEGYVTSDNHMLGLKP